MRIRNSKVILSEPDANMTNEQDAKSAQQKTRAFEKKWDEERENGYSKWLLLGGFKDISIAQRAVFKISLSFHYTGCFISIPRSWIIVIPSMEVSYK